MSGIKRHQAATSGNKRQYAATSGIKRKRRKEAQRSGNNRSPARTARLGSSPTSRLPRAEALSARPPSRPGPGSRRGPEARFCGRAGGRARPCAFPARLLFEPRRPKLRTGPVYQRSPPKEKGGLRAAIAHATRLRCLRCLRGSCAAGRFGFWLSTGDQHPAPCRALLPRAPRHPGRSERMCINEFPINRSDKYWRRIIRWSKNTFQTA